MSQFLRRIRRTTTAVLLGFALSATAGLATGSPAQAAQAGAAPLPPIGSVLCHSGPVSGWQCGTLVAVNQTVVYPGGPVYGLFRYTACAAPGDGGAPVYRSDGAQVGTVFGGGGGGGGAQCTTFGQPLR